jgi:WavE lipopolysaccharide synthesis
VGSTQKSVASVRTHLPGARIILSTWEGQDCSGLEVDTLLLHSDPGANIESYAEAGNANMANFNRQIVSSAQGLKKVTTPYAMKLRSDNFLTGTDFKQAQQAFDQREQADSLFAERVVVSTCYFRRFSSGHPVIMLPSDLFHFGRTEDLLKIWDLPLFEDFVFNPAKLGQKQYLGSPKTALHAEQRYCQKWLSLLDPKAPKLAHRHDVNSPSIVYWNKFIASNLVVLESSQIGLGLISRFIPKSKRPNEISHLDWLLCYKKYCDSEVNASQWQLFCELGWKRMLKFPFSRLKLKLKKN